MTTPQNVLGFWLDEVGPKGWYEVSDTLDQKITEKFHDTWRAAAQGGHTSWLTSPDGVLAYLVLLDQFPRNMFRGQGAAFDTDKIARTAAKAAIDKGWDLRVDEPQRQFFYLPLMHSECLSDQERCVRLICERMPETGAPNLLHARAHREVIRQFGRFPYRNDALDRRDTQAERDYVAAGGYGTTVRQLQMQDAA